MSILFNNYDNCQKFTSKQPSFPAALKTLELPPQQINVLGAPFKSWLERPKLAIVGSRKASPYGRHITSQLTEALARRGVVIISGLALGIDAIAHQAAIKAGGLTVAVLPTPLNQIYPAAHFGLAKQIIESGGSLISEYPDGAEVFKINFIARNRIVSALADALLITEAAATSGTMHTARFALSQGKTVMAVPGNINQPGSEGTNNLIKSGALPVTDASDIFFAMGLSIDHRRTGQPKNLSKVQQLIIESLSSGVSDQDQIVQIAKISPSQLSSELTMLEIAGLVRPLGAGRWVLA